MSPRLKIRNVTLRRRNNIANGDCFQPERWQPNDPDAALLAELFMPFSLGRRNCVGQNLAMLELKMVLSPPLPTLALSAASSLRHPIACSLAFPLAF